MDDCKPKEATGLTREQKQQMLTKVTEGFAASLATAAVCEAIAIKLKAREAEGVEDIVDLMNKAAETIRWSLNLARVYGDVIVELVGQVDACTKRAEVAEECNKELRSQLH